MKWCRGSKRGIEDARTAGRVKPQQSEHGKVYDEENAGNCGEGSSLDNDVRIATPISAPGGSNRSGSFVDLGRRGLWCFVAPLVPW